MERNRRPPGVEEALSSMLWTPYERTPSDSSEDEHVSPIKLRSACDVSRNFKLGHSLDYSVKPSEAHLYPKPIRYGFPVNTANVNLKPWFSHSFNKQVRQHQLPTYEYIEQERHHHSLNTIGGLCNDGAGIYVIPPYASYCNGNSTMVNSFTDDFLQYQVRPYNITQVNLVTCC